MAMFHGPPLHLLSRLALSPVALERLIAGVAALMRDCPFHNFRHVFTARRPAPPAQAADQAAPRGWAGP